MSQKSVPRRGAVYSQALAARVCARIAAGESVAAVCRDPEMPAPATLVKWRRTRPGFEAAYRAAQALAGGRGTGGRPSDYTPELAAAICARLTAGEALHRVCADPAMPGLTAVYRWLRLHPEFHEAYLQAREICAHRRFDEAWEIAQAATPETVAVARLQIEAIRWQVAKLAPRSFGESPASALGGITVVIRKFGEAG